MIWLLAQNVVNAAGGGDETFFFWGLALLGIAVVLLSLELFVPSGGLIGMLAAVAAIGSIVSFFKYDTSWGIGATCAYVILGPIVIIFGFRLWLNSPLAKGMILGGQDSDSTHTDDDEDDSPMSQEHARQERLAQLRQLVGAQGQAVTPLRPVGTVKINGQRIDAMAESGVIDTGTPIVVVEVYDNQIKVRPL